MKSFKYYMLAACVRAMTYLYKRRDGQRIDI